jgi:hypothetical protein
MNTVELKFILASLNTESLGSYKKVLRKMKTMDISISEQNLHHIKLLSMENKDEDYILNNYSSLSISDVSNLESKHELKPKAERKESNSKSKVTNSNAKGISQTLANGKKNIMEYQIIAGKSHYELEEQVQNAINGGWEPLGGMAVYNAGGKIGSVPDHFFQTIVRYK